MYVRSASFFRFSTIPGSSYVNQNDCEAPRHLVLCLICRGGPFGFDVGCTLFPFYDSRIVPLLSPLQIVS
jgi:hypothetical protein